MKLLANPETNRRYRLRYRIEVNPCLGVLDAPISRRRLVFTTLVAALRPDRFEAAGVAFSLEAQIAAALGPGLSTSGCRLGVSLCDEKPEVLRRIVALAASKNLPYSAGRATCKK